MAGIFETLIRDSDRVISIVGGGGKTSIMFLLAQAFQRKGIKVISTTTTRILKPNPQQTGGVFCFDYDGFQDNLQNCLKQDGHATVAHHLLSSGNKLQGITCKQAEQIFRQSSAERMLIEADGARNLSFKAPGDNEPVVSQITDVFISVVGLDVIGRPLDDKNVFRAGLISERTGLAAGAEIMPLTVAKLAVHPKGLLKGCPENARSYIFMNKTDIPGNQQKALLIVEAAKKLKGKKPDFWISGSTREDVCTEHFLHST